MKVAPSWTAGLAGSTDGREAMMPCDIDVTPMVDSNGQADSLSWMRKPTPNSPLFKWLSPSELDEAINTPLPSKPPPVHFRRQTKLRSPPYFDNLTRSTMPTATVDQRLSRPPPILLSKNKGSSLDTLRSVQTRSSSGSASNSSTTSWWFQSSAPVTPDPEPAPKEYLTPNNPVIFCHGLLGFDSVTIGPAIAPLQVAHWRGIKEVLEQNGAEVLITRVPATSSPMDRAKVLEEAISQKYPGRSVHLIGHSMGGLDCRYLTSHLTHRQFKVLSVTTIATPHRGSAFASTFLSTVGSSRMPSVLSLLALLPNGGGDGKAFTSLTPESMRAFNEETPNIEGVRYFSWGAVYQPGLIDTWKWPHSVILDQEGENDGLVSVESAKWGTYLGTLHNVNHLDLVGWVNTARYKWAEMLGKEIKFKPETFYLGVCDMLAREVENQTTEHSDVGVNKTKAQQEQEQMLDSLGKAGAETKESNSKTTKEEGVVQKASGSKKNTRNFSTSSLVSSSKTLRNDTPSLTKLPTKSESRLELSSTPAAKHHPEAKLELLPPTPPIVPAKLELLPTTPPLP